MGLLIDPSTSRYTRNELIEELRSRFGKFEEGTFRHWQEVGLAASPSQEHRWRKGVEGSREALWSEHDRRMLIALLELRERHRLELGTQLGYADLANFVVWSWVFYEDVIAIDQARRALRTWTYPQIGGPIGGVRSRRRILTRCRESIDAIAAPEVPDRRRSEVAASLASVLWEHDLQQLATLEPDLASVIDPLGRGRRVGALGLSADARAEIERLTVTHFGAEAVVTGRPVQSDRDWLTARAVVRAGWSGYAKDWYWLRATATTPQMFRQPTLDQQIADSSRVLLMVLGDVATRLQA